MKPYPFTCIIFPPFADPSVISSICKDEPNPDPEPEPEPEPDPCTFDPIESQPAKMEKLSAGGHKDMTLTEYRFIRKVTEADEYFH